MPDTIAGTTQNTGTEAPAEGATLLTGGTPAGAPDPGAGSPPASGAAPTGQTDPKAGEGEAPKGEETPKAEEAPKPKAPEKYEFKVADGTPLDPKAVEAFEPLARKLDLSQEDAQELVDFQLGLVKAQNDAWVATTKAWENEVKADPVLGGKNLDSTLATSKAALKKFGDPTLVELLDKYGLGNHPGFIRFTHNVGKAMAEDDFKTGSGSASEEDTLTARAQRMFPNSLKQ